MPFNLNDTFGDDFPIERQRMSNWCWAACTAAVGNFYEQKLMFGQAQIVATMLKLPICKSAFPSAICNKKLDFGIALNKAGYLLGDVIEQPLTPNNLLAALNTGRPVCCQMDIPQMGGHAIVIISGKKDNMGKVLVSVADPSDGSILVMSFSALRNNFRSTGGRWVRTYLTKPFNEV